MTLHIFDLAVHALLFAALIWLLWAAGHAAILHINKRSDYRNRREKLYQNCLVYYLAALIHITVIRGNIRIFPWEGHSLETIQGIPFVDLISLAHQGFLPFLYMFVGNLIWFVPIGLFVFANHRERSSFLAALKAGFLTSLAIECLQWLFQSGISDIDDLILNTLGAGLGWLLGLWTSKILAPKADCR